ALPLHADEAIVAVATNFTYAARHLVAEFEETSAHQIVLVPGSTGRLYAQIVNGAPYAVFLAADASRPQLLEAQGLTVQGSRSTYAIGRLALFRRGSAAPRESWESALGRGDFRHLAVAEPELAPYGAASVEVMERLGLADKLKNKLVVGESVGQVSAFLATGNAELGFLSLSHAMRARELGFGDFWLIPDGWHSPILQEMVLMRAAEDNQAAVEFHEFLSSERALSLIRASGYVISGDSGSRSD
ncbi:MAG: molybdate ABC transporter substrate-binding protein, partial [Rhodobacteraceae bacterium]|nr:molybdate ABC transporter substrate-binding protein [Paracoccaceae bacterium]